MEHENQWPVHGPGYRSLPTRNQPHGVRPRAPFEETRTATENGAGGGTGRACWFQREKRPGSMNTTRNVIVALTAAFAVAAPVDPRAQTSLDLPDIGDSLAAEFPLSREKRLGPVILRQLRARLPVIEDVELNEYLSNLGKQLLSADTNKQLDFNFLLVGQPQINAFATPGGVICINSGLMLATSSESDLAGVLAHEITHVTQRHLARLVAASQQTSWVGYLVAISAVLAAVYDSRLAQVGARAGTALPIERSLGYSRTFEHEADRLGMQLMAAAGYNPAGMPRFFSHLQSRESGNYVPEFLRTHPLTANRLSDALNHARLMQGEYRDNSKEFMFAKARLEALTDPQRALSIGPEEEEPVAVTRYRRAVALTRTGQAHKAARMLEDVPRSRESIATGLALAEAFLAQGNPREAITLLEALNALYPGRESIAYHLSYALIRTNRPGAALIKLRALMRRPHAPALSRLAAKAAAADGKTWLSHKYLADYHQVNGRMNMALRQLELADKDPLAKPSARKLIEAERKKIEQLREQMKAGS